MGIVTWPSRRARPRHRARAPRCRARRDRAGEVDRVGGVPPAACPVAAAAGRTERVERVHRRPPSAASSHDRDPEDRTGRRPHDLRVVGVHRRRRGRPPAPRRLRAAQRACRGCRDRATSTRDEHRARRRRARRRAARDRRDREHGLRRAGRPSFSSTPSFRSQHAARPRAATLAARTEGVLGAGAEVAQLERAPRSSAAATAGALRARTPLGRRGRGSRSSAAAA